jgi:uncharacterized protein YqiB (DUF1249 family)
MNLKPWLRLIQRLDQETPRLRSEFLEILVTHEGYDQFQISEEDLRKTAMRTFSLFVDRLSGTGYDEDSVAFIDALGRSRARQGVRFEHFMDAVRINFRILWRGLERVAKPDLSHVLLTNGERVLDVVERYATEVQSAFTDELERMKAQSATRRDSMIRKLFSDNVNNTELEESARELKIRLDDTYELLAVKEADFQDTWITQLVGTGVLTYRDDRTVYLVRRKTHTSMPEEIHDARGGYLSTVLGVRAINSAAKLAQKLSDLDDTKPAVTLKTGFVQLVSQTLSDELFAFHHELVGDFVTLPQAEKSRLISTVKVYATNGSIQETADELFVHRNTIFKRFKRLQQVTGLDMAKPQEVAIAMTILPRLDSV